MNGKRETADFALGVAGVQAAFAGGLLRFARELDQELLGFFWFGRRKRVAEFTLNRTNGTHGLFVTGGDFESLTGALFCGLVSCQVCTSGLT